jgi:protoporphyrin/coproporphyrin ferrochelatase
MSDPPIGLLVMAYGSATGVDDIERYYTDIRGGRPPAPEHLQALKDRYAAIGNRFPLLEITTAQARGLARALNREAGAERFRPYLGMKHSPPFIPDGVSAMRRDGIEHAIGIVMAPHWSGMSVANYVERVEQAVSTDGGPSFSYVSQWYDHPRFVELLADRVVAALDRFPAHDRREAAVIFSAHSLPLRALEDGSERCLRCWADRCAASCTYRDQLQHTADLVAGKAGVGTYVVAWQSAGRTPDPWWGPPIEDVIRALADARHPAVVVCSAGFAADHLEILYDLDIEAQQVASQAGIRLERTEMPNADPEFIQTLAAILRDHVQEKEVA